MNPTRRSLVVPGLQQRVQSKAKRASAPRMPRLKRELLRAKKKRTAREIAQISKSEKSRDSILEAAAKLFRRQGYSATTLRQIAAMAEIKAGSIYYYFDSKEAILNEVCLLYTSPSPRD